MRLCHDAIVRMTLDQLRLSDFPLLPACNQPWMSRHSMTTDKVYLLDTNVPIALSDAEPGMSASAGRCGGDARIPRVTGHKQLTHAYLVLLARKHGGSVATMDQSPTAIHAGTTLLT